MFMADWFKFYDNSLDETRFQYAVSKLPEVIPVWVGILSECSRHKSDTISWQENEIELFGFSRRLNVTIPKVNLAINILAEISYIEKSGGFIRVLKWNELQSDYCQKKTRLQNQGGDNIRTVSGQCPDNGGQEERRGDKKEKTEIQLRIEKLFNKKPTTAWDKSELTAWKTAEALVADLTEDDWSVLTAFYSAPQSETYARKSLATLLNNINGELARAYIWKQKNPRKIDARPLYMNRFNANNPPRRELFPNYSDDDFAEIMAGYEKWKEGNK